MRPRPAPSAMRTDISLAREVARANRMGSGLTFMTIDLDNFRAINERFGTMEGNFVLAEFARILKSVFRGADIVFRQGGDEFLIVMPETTELEADFPVQRLVRMVQEWNSGNEKDYKLAFAYAVASYVTGGDVTDALRALDRKMYQKRHNLVPVF